jgi:hypothetical protein
MFFGMIQGSKQYHSKTIQFDSEIFEIQILWTRVGIDIGFMVEIRIYALASNYATQ